MCVIAIVLTCFSHAVVLAKETRVEIDSEPFRWIENDGRLAYGIPHSNVTLLNFSCQAQGHVTADVEMRPANLAAGRARDVKFTVGTRTVAYRGVAPSADGLDGNNVQISLPLTARLFNLMSAGSLLEVGVGRESIKFPLMGVKGLILRFKSSCRQMKP
jgi:hypothetical protein